MKKLNVLITNQSLEGRTGTTLYTFDLARGLLAANHSPVLYSPRPGDLAQRLRIETVPVVDDLNILNSTPDIIHGQHTAETVTALVRFPRTPAIYVCHDWYYATDNPPKFPNIRRYVAVDSACRDKLVFEHGIPEERVRVVLGFVDLDKFRPRAPLPATPQRALIFCNQTSENEYLEAARAACARKNISLDVYGRGMGRVSEHPEELLPQYDIVFAKGRAALEALAVGTSVIAYWWRRVGPMVTASELDRLRDANFGMRAMGPKSTPEEFGQQCDVALSQYDASDAAQVSARVRTEAGQDLVVSELISIYEEVIAEHAATGVDEEAHARATASYVRQLAIMYAEERHVMHATTPFLVGERLRKTPVVGRVARVVARKFAGKDGGNEK